MELKEGEKYLTGELDFGVLGKIKIVVFKNTKKKSEKSPEFNIMRVAPDSKLKKCGALWVQTKKATQPQPEIDEMDAVF